MNFQIGDKVTHKEKLYVGDGIIIKFIERGKLEHDVYEVEWNQENKYNQRKGSGFYYPFELELDKQILRERKINKLLQ